MDNFEYFQFYLLFVIVVINLLVGFLVGTLAKNKGYKFWNWFFACSILGLIWIMASRNTVTENLSDEMKNDILRRGNTTGIVLSIITFILSCIAMF